jgi:hypothetical protein
LGCEDQGNSWALSRAQRRDLKYRQGNEMTAKVEQLKIWTKPRLVQLGTIAAVAATQNNLVQTGNSKS